MSDSTSGSTVSESNAQTIPSEWSGQSTTRKRITAAAYAALVIVLGTLAVLNVQHHRAESAAVDAREMAESGLKALLSYQSADVEQELDDELHLLTGPFRREYEQLMTKSIIPSAKKGDVVTRATVVTSGVGEHSVDHVRLLVFVNVTTTSNELKDPRVSGSRLKVDVTLVDGVWKISSFTPV